MSLNNILLIILGKNFKIKYQYYFNLILLLLFSIIYKKKKKINFHTNILKYRIFFLCSVHKKVWVCIIYNFFF